MIDVHTYTAGEAGLLVNAYLVETDHGVVAVDGTLTVSDSRALRARIDAIGKPLLAVLITHAHPDHVAGVATIVGASDTPIIALGSIMREMQATEAAKRAQWGPVFGAEWIERWAYPNHIVRNNETVTFDGVSFQVHDLGAGGDCPANCIWVLEADRRVAFVGDLIFNGTHAYVADGHTLRWLANLERIRPLLDAVATIYPGHGPAGTVALVDTQRDYLLAYCAAVTDVANGSARLDDAQKQVLTRRMEEYLPAAPLGFMIALSADAVAAELG